MNAVKPETSSPSSEQVRLRIAELATARGDSLTLLSQLISKNDAYLGQFIRRGVPERLPEYARLLLAMYFSVDERELGARDPWEP